MTTSPRRSARVEKKNQEDAWRLGMVFMEAARRFWESGGGHDLPPSVLRLERTYEEALKKCSKRGQIVVSYGLDDQPLPEE